MSKYIVRYGLMRILGVMNSRNGTEFRRGMEVIVRSDRGLEVGQVLCEATDDALSHLDRPAIGQIVRQVTNGDTGTIDSLDTARKYKLSSCQKHITTLNLDMKLVDVESLFGGERLIVFYLSDDRVDFRELVKLLASEFQTRIEMKQIGIRDEAKILADYGDCGQPVCCNNHLVTMPPVSMKMAKLQKATLDPTKLSGRCGRLKCCLRYEFDTYEEIQRKLPRVGSHVLTRDGKARVLNQQIISEQLLVEMEDRRRIVIDASEVLSVIENATANSKDFREKSNTKPKDPKTRENQNSPTATGTTETKNGNSSEESSTPSTKISRNRPATKSRDRRKDRKK